MCACYFLTFLFPAMSFPSYMMIPAFHAHRIQYWYVLNSIPPATMTDEEYAELECLEALEAYEERYMMYSDY
jgi:hypothetical protein